MISPSHFTWKVSHTPGYPGRKSSAPVQNTAKPGDPGILKEHSETLTGDFCHKCDRFANHSYWVCWWEIGRCLNERSFERSRKSNKLLETEEGDKKTFKERAKLRDDEFGRIAISSWRECEPLGALKIGRVKTEATRRCRVFSKHKKFVPSEGSVCELW